MTRITIRYKLLAALFVPVLAVGVVTFTQVRRADAELREVEAETSLAWSIGGPGTLLTAVLMERDRMGVDMIGFGDAVVMPVKDVDEARARTDEAIAEFQRAMADLGPEAEATYRAAFANLTSQLPDIRRTMDDYDGPLGFVPIVDVLYEGYSDLARPFYAANDDVVRRLDDRVLRDRAQAIADVTYVSDVTSRMSRFAALTTLADRMTPNGRIKASDMFSKYQSARIRAVSMLEGSSAEDIVRDYYERPTQQQWRELIVDFLETDRVDMAKVIEVAAEFETAKPAAWEATRRALRERSAELVDAAEATRQRYVGVFAGSTLLAIAMAMLFARSIGRPLLSLTEQADAMANRHLPAAVGQVLDTPLGQDVQVPSLHPVAVRSRDEVADVAQALTTVQGRALDLAVEQAVLRRNLADAFVSMGRRTQNLVGRQLDFISQLEEGETDPGALEDLFRLDHLATRIQRNAESLVVLAGAEPPRTWSRALPMVDLVRAAIGEVEGYERVVVDRVAAAWVPGAVAADLVHLLAELVENGTTFSPPDTQVTVTGSHQGGSYLITVADQGPGMSSDDMEVANVRLAGTESFTVAPSKYLGHYVAGHLARRLGGHVSLVAGPAGGVVARVHLPLSLLQAPPADVSPRQVGGTPTTLVDGVPPPASSSPPDSVGRPA